MSDETKREGMVFATKLVCAYCADEDNWLPAKKGTYPEWWHLSAHGFNVRNQCSSWAIHHWLEQRDHLQREELTAQGSQRTSS